MRQAIAFLFVVQAIMAQAKPTVAILDFEGQGVSAGEVQTLTERMRTEIGNTNAVRLIERKAVEKILEEQGLQQSGCTTDECAAEVGQLLGVQFMISGSIGKMGGSYTIDSKMFSVETGETIRSKNATHAGDISGLLTEMEIMAWEIVGLEAPSSLRLKRAGKDASQTVAVLDFEGRGITMQEAQTLTDRFTTSLASTEKVTLVERGTMMDVLEEQGFESGGCASDECAAEVGAMLGVEFMISGAIGKLGETYTIDAKMFSVATGAAESMKSITYTGKVDGLIVEIEILAWDILGLLDERYARQVKIVSGSPEAVALAIDDILSLIPAKLSLDGNYPNPFNPVTTIRFGLPEPRRVQLSIVNILGQEVITLLNDWQDLGTHTVVWNSRDRADQPVPTGVYFTILNDGRSTVVRKIMLLK